MKNYHGGMSDSVGPAVDYSSGAVGMSMGMSTELNVRRTALEQALALHRFKGEHVTAEEVIATASAFAEFVLGESIYDDDDLAFTDASVADVGAELDRQDAAAPRPTPAEIAACYGHVLDA